MSENVAIGLSTRKALKQGFSWAVGLFLTFFRPVVVLLVVLALIAVVGDECVRLEWWPGTGFSAACEPSTTTSP